MKKFALALLALVLVLGLCAVASADCGDTDTHTGYEWEVVKEATCLEAGLKVAVCDTCGKYVVVNGSNITTAASKDKASTWATPAALDHEPSAPKYDYPTCYASGSVYTECTRCGITLTEELIDKREHDLELVQAATCTAPAKYICKWDDCDYTKTDDANGHAWGNPVRDVAATCTKDGYKFYECAICEAEKTVIVDKLDHKNANGTSAYQLLKVLKPATCTETGKESWQCALCFDVQYKTTDELGHKFGDWHIDEMAKCLTEGFKSRDCLRDCCYDAATGRAYEEVEVIPATGHSFVAYAVVTPATCEGEGLERAVCGSCGLTDEVVIPANGHDFNEWKVQVEATETACGVKTRTCKVCDYVEFATIPCLGAVAPETPADPDAPAVDEDDENESEGSGSTTGSGSDASIPATGDNTSNVPYIMMVAAVAGLVVLVASKRKVNC